VSILTLAAPKSVLKKRVLEKTITTNTAQRLDVQTNIVNLNTKQSLCTREAFVRDITSYINVEKYELNADGWFMNKNSEKNTTVHNKALKFA